MVIFTRFLTACLLFIVCFAGMATAQMLNLEWVSNLPSRDYGSVTSNSVKADAQGNVYVAGTYSGIVKIFNGTDSTALPTAEGTRAFVAKFNSSGHLTWVQTIVPGVSGYAYDESHGVAVDAQGNVYWAGMTGTFTATVAGSPQTFTSVGGLDIMIAKLSASGNFIWIKTFGSTTKDETNDITLDVSGNIYVTGTFRGNTSEVVNFGSTSLTKVGSAAAGNMYALSLNNTGGVRWVMTGTSGNNVITGRAITTDQAGDVYVTGDYKGAANFGGTTVINSSGLAPFILKLSNSGATTWVKGYVGNWEAFGRGIAVDKSGSVYTVGDFKGTYDFDPMPGGTATVKNLVSHPSGSGALDGFVAKLNSSGEYLWAHAIFSTTSSSTAHDGCRAVTVDKDDNVYITGDFFGTADFDPDATDEYPLTSRGGRDIFVYKLEPSGNFLWAYQMGGTNANNESGYGIFVDDDYTVYTTGVYRESAEFSLNPGTSSVIMNSGGTPNTVGFLHKVSQRFCTPTSASLSLTDCDSIRVNGQKYTSGGTYMQTLVNAAGCDSVLTLNLTVNHSVIGSSINHTVCDSFSFNNQTHYTSGAYVHVLNTAAGCDSTVTLNLTVNNSVHTILTEDVCASYAIDTFTYTETGVYEHMFETVDGCDSLVTLHLTVLHTADTITADACFSFVAGADTFTRTGLYTQTFTNIAGCDSLVTIDLTIRDLDVSVVRSGITLTAGQAGASYQWLDCDDDYKELAGATQQMFAPDSNGHYAVAITWDGCTDTSACYEITGIATDNSVPELNSTGILVYPNPAKHTLFISSAGYLLKSVRVSGITGNLLMQRQDVAGERISIDISGFASGMYLLEIDTGKEVSRMTVIKE